MSGGTELAIEPESRPYQPRGAALQLFYCKDQEILCEGVAGSGKSRGALEKVHLCMMKYAGARALVVRKTRASMGQSTLVTFEDKVVQVGLFGHGGPSRDYRHSYMYPNGSELVIGGLDNPSKMLGPEYDIILVDEATEIDEAGYEILISRLRNHVMPYQQAICCCNPDAPSHWLNQRALKGMMTRFVFRHHDNPSVTADYLSMLDRMTGVRRLRLRDGLWAGAEGRVYDEFDPAVHVLCNYECKPEDFKRIIGSIDWGWTNAGVIQIWAEDSDGRLYLVREVYHTQKTTEWWADQARRYMETLGVGIYVCDPAEPDRMNEFERRGIPVDKAYKSIHVGINAVKERLVVAGDGKPRLFILDDALVTPDHSLMESKRPWSTKQEFDSYQWNSRRDEPVKADDHGMDAMRYAVAYVDNLSGRGVELV